MALIKCPDCGRDISDKAPACPHCGRPSAGERQVSASAPKTPQKARMSLAAWGGRYSITNDADVREALAKVAAMPKQTRRLASL